MQIFDKSYKLIQSWSEIYRTWFVIKISRKQCNKIVVFRVDLINIKPKRIKEYRLISLVPI